MRSIAKSTGMVRDRFSLTFFNSTVAKQERSTSEIGGDKSTGVASDLTMPAETACQDKAQIIDEAEITGIVVLHGLFLLILGEQHIVLFNFLESVLCSQGQQV